MRWSGRIRASIRWWRSMRATAARIGSARDRAAAGQLFQRAQVALAAGQCAGRAAHVPRRATLAFGTVDSWLVWHLTGQHLTDVTNASRTQLMNLATLDWDDALLSAFGIPRAVLPRIVASSAVYGNGARARWMACRSLAFSATSRRRWWGRRASHRARRRTPTAPGCFLLMNTGRRRWPRTSGLVTTVACQFGDAPACYALEGSIAVTGALVQWLRDNLGLIRIECRGRGAGRVGCGQWRCVFRAGVLRTVCAVLAGRCARGDRRADRLCHRRAYRARGAGGDRLPDARCDRGDGAGFGHRDQHAARRWRHGGERTADAVPGRHAQRSGGAAAHDRDAPRWGRPMRRGWRLAIGTTSDDLRRNWGVARTWQPHIAHETRAALAAGWRRAIERSFGWA